MHSRLLKVLVVLTLVSITTDLYAQFRGGSGNGADRLVHQPNTCSPSDNSNIYFGGDANGAGVAVLKQTLCPSPENVSIYFGGDGNGATVLKAVFSVCSPSENLSIFSGGQSGMFAAKLVSCTPSESTQIYYGGNANGGDAQRIISCPSANVTVPNIFTGGNAGGYELAPLVQTVCATSENINVFRGGDANGDASALAIQAPCTPLVNANIFFGGDANGDAAGLLVQGACPPVENLNIFTGGATAGYRMALLNQTACASTENLSIFFGGNANGDAIVTLLQSICTAPENIDIFTGGDADGYAGGLLAQKVCASPENINIFVGGDADGYAGAALAQTVCSSPENLNIFRGGDADGYMVGLVVQSVCAPPENVNIFAGGVANGESMSSLISCTQPEVVNIYFGGIANGGAYTNITMCPVATPINFYTGGDSGGADALRFTKSACPPAQNLSIYFGGANNGAASLRAISSVCPIPENQNIYLGGLANGASGLVTINSVCPTPENLNIYLGSVANGAASLLAKVTSCVPSENQNIFFGGRADGYDVKLLIQPYYWTGAVDHNWHNADNWSNGIVPDISALAIVPNVPNDPIISDAPAYAKGIVLQSGADLTVSSKNLTVASTVSNDGNIIVAGSPTVTVGGNFDSASGSLTSGSSTFVFNGSEGAQEVKINIGDFNNVEVATTNGVVCKLFGTVNVRGDVAITSGTLDGGNANITVAGSWNDGGTFVPSSSSVSFTGAFASISSVAAVESFYNLKIGASTSLSLGQDVAAAGTLAMDGGTILTGTYKLTVGRSAAQPGAISYVGGRVVGKLERWITSSGSFLFPIGTPSNLRSVTIDAGAGVVPGSVLMYFVNSNPGVGGLPLSDAGLPIEATFTEGFWNATALNGLSIPTYSVSVDANGFSSFTLSGSARLVKRTNSGGWKLDGTHLDMSGTLVNRTGLAGGISPLGTQLAVAPVSCNGGQILDNFTICTSVAVPPFANQTLAVGGAGSFTYTWQYSDNLSAVPGDASWVDVAATNSSSYTVGGAIPNSRLYVRKAVGTGCPTPVYSNSVKVTVNPLPKTGAVFHIANNIAL